MARSSSRFVETEWCFSWKWKESLLEFRKRPRVFSVGNSAKVISNCGLLRLSGEILDSTERDDESQFVRLKPPSFSRAVRFFWRWMASALESIDVGDIDGIQLRNPGSWRRKSFSGLSQLHRDNNGENFRWSCEERAYKLQVKTQHQRYGLPWCRFQVEKKSRVGTKGKQSNTVHPSLQGADGTFFRCPLRARWDSAGTWWEAGEDCTAIRDLWAKRRSDKYLDV